jgi:hypothetical protein
MTANPKARQVPRNLLSISRPTAVRLVLMAALAVSSAGWAVAQTVVPEDWSYEQLYQRGISASFLMETVKVRATTEGTGGYAEEGTVFDLVIGLDGELLSIIVRLGTPTDVSQRFVNVPWDEATLRSGRLEVVVSAAISDPPVSPSAAITARQAGVNTTDVGEEVTLINAFKATALLGDQVRLEDHTSFGYTEDLVFSRGWLLGCTRSGNRSARRS